MDGARKKIILVDDIKSNLDQGRSILDPFYQVYPATSAKKMFDFLAKLLPELILLDIEMPEMNGYEALRKLKEDERYADIPVIFLTAKSDEGSEREGFDAGAADYVAKPFSAPLLLKRIENQLLIAEQKSDLKKALRKAEQASSTKSRFLANMSHEMRTPLNAIIGLTGLTLENDGLDWETRSNLEKIYSAGATLLNIVNDVLDLSKIEAGKLELVSVDYDVPSLINDTVTQNILRIGEKPIELRIDVSEDIFARLHGDELRVKQIINNLLSNAIKYTKEGTVELTIHCGHSAEEDDTVWVTIQVKDTGRGIRNEDIGKLFSDYSQVDMKANRKIEGTGLGLPITKKLVEEMHGTINVESEYGKGSVFTVKIAQEYVSNVKIGPKILENLKNFRYTDEKRNKSVRFKRIQLPYARVLVVDDNATNLDVAKGLMKPYGMQIDCVTSGQEAINVIRSESFRGEKVTYSAIFMDHMMPEMDGIEATGLIRKIGTDYAKNIPIIALTANALAGNEEMFLSKGFQAFLSKPIDLPLLDDVIRHWIRDKSKEKEYPAEETARQDGTADRKWLTENEIDGLNLVKGYERFGEDEKTYISVLRSYAKNSRLLVDLLRDADKKILARDKDSLWKLDDYATTVHGVKGSSYGIFADCVGSLAESLEKASKAGDFDFVIKNNHILLAAMEQLISDIDDMLHRITAGKSKPKIEKPDAKTLQKLIAACNAYDISGAEELITELEEFEYETNAELTDWLKESLSKGFFEEITEKLSGIIRQEVL